MVRAAVAAIVAGSVTVGAAEPASAEGTLGDGEYDSVGGGSIWLGNFIMDSAYVFCAGETFYDDPLPAGQYGSTVWLDGSNGDSWTGKWGGSSSAPSIPASGNRPLRQSGADLNVANGSSRTQDGRTLTGSNLNRIGYLLAHYGATNGNDTRATDLRLLFMEKFDVMIYSTYYDYLDGSTSSERARRDRLDAYWNEAMAYAGPYDTDTVSITIDSDGGGGTFDGIGFYSEADNLMAGYGWTAEILTGNVTWDANGSSILTGTTTTSLQSADFSVVPGGSGIVEIEVIYDNVPDWRVGIRESRNDPTNDQAVMRGRHIALDGYAFSFDEVYPTFEVEIETTTSAAVAAAGDTITDELRVSLVRGLWEPVDYEATVTSTLYGPFDTEPVQSSSVPSGAPVVGTVTTTISGEGTYTTPGIVVPESGYYTWVETIPFEADRIEAWASDFGRPSEITLVPWDPTGVTAVSTGTAVQGDTVSDSATITGGQPGGSTTVTFELYKDAGTQPPAEQGSVPLDATLIDTQTATANFDASGDATVSVDFTVPIAETPGYLTIVLTIEGNAAITEFVSNYGIEDETFVVPWAGAASTVARRERGNVFYDEVTITGLPADYGALADETEPLNVDLYFVHESFTGDVTTQCTVDNMIATASTPARNGTFDVTGDEFDLPDIASEAMNGTYMFVHRFDGTERVAAFSGACGETLETLALTLTDFNPDDLAESGPDDDRLRAELGAAVALLFFGGTGIAAAAALRPARERAVAAQHVGGNTYAPRRASRRG